MRIKHFALSRLKSAASLSRGIVLRGYSQNTFNQPKDGGVLVRAAGISSVFRLPIQEDNPNGLDVCFVGIPMDNGCSTRSGTRMGPRAIRHESCMIRPTNGTGASPFESLQVADIGDVPVIPYSLQRTIDVITQYFTKIMAANCIPLAMGGDHTMTYPILRAIKEKHGPVGLVQIDAHHDLLDTSLGEKIAHGTPFRRAIEEGLLDPKMVIQIGLRGSIYSNDHVEIYDWAKEKGIRQIFASQCWHKSMVPLMKNIRNHLRGIPTYITFDIDGIDPSDCPGTGTPEVGGLTPVQALEIVRGLNGLNIVGGDIVEVNPQFDSGGMTALMAANLLHEMLCVLPGVKYKENLLNYSTDWV